MSTLNTKRGKIVVSSNSDGVTTNMDCRFRYSNDITHGTCTYKVDGILQEIICDCSLIPNYYPSHCPMKNFDALNIRKIAL